MCLVKIFLIPLFAAFITGTNGGIADKSQKWEGKTIQPTIGCENNLTCKVIDAIQVFTTFGRHATPDRHEFTIDRLWGDSMNQTKVLIGNIDRLVFDLLRLNRFFLLETAATYIQDIDGSDSIALLRRYFKDNIQVFKTKVAKYFCAHRRCQNGGICSLKKLEDILSYKTVLSLPGLIYQTIDEIYNLEAGELFFKYFEIIPNVNVGQMVGVHGDELFSLRAIFTPVDLETAERVLGVFNAEFNRTVSLSFTAAPGSVFDGEQLAFLGRVLIALSDIAYHGLPAKEAAEMFITCQCSTNYSASTCSFNEVPKNRPTAQVFGSPW